MLYPRLRRETSIVRIVHFIADCPSVRVRQSALPDPSSSLALRPTCNLDAMSVRMIRPKATARRARALRREMDRRCETGWLATDADATSLAFDPPLVNSSRGQASGLGTPERSIPKVQRPKKGRGERGHFLTDRSHLAPSFVLGVVTRIVS